MLGARLRKTIQVFHATVGEHEAGCSVVVLELFRDDRIHRHENSILDERTQADYHGAVIGVEDGFGIIMRIELMNSEGVILS
jgi:hypothetical protein